MIQGAIEVVRENVVAGWIYAHAGEGLRNELVLAFSGPRCVGQGRVEIFRRDLLDAGLGDGYCGFHFLIELQPGEHPASVVIRPVNCDAALIQVGSWLVPAKDEPAIAPQQPAARTAKTSPASGARLRQAAIR